MGRSKVWGHFVPSSDNKEATCKYCNTKIANSGSTSSLWNHYNSKHRILNSEGPEADSNNGEGCSSTPIVIPTAPCNKRRRTSTGDHPAKQVSSARAEEITKAICKMIAIDMQPLSIVEDAGFIELMRVLEPGYTIPCRKSITNRTRNLYEEVKEKANKKLDQVDHVALASDAWTSNACDSYLTVSAHFLDEDWLPKKITLGTYGCSEKHTAVNIRSYLTEVINDWNIVDKVVAIVHDNGANFVRAVEDIHSTGSIFSQRCAAHTLQLAINNALTIEECESVVKKASELVSAFRHSYIRTAALESYLKALGLPEHRLQQKCATRWDSTFHMLERVSELRSGITTALADRSVFKSSIAAKLELCEHDWVAIDTLVGVLKPLQQATTLLCSDSSITISLIRPIMSSLITRHLEINEQDSGMIRTLKSRISQGISNRFNMAIVENSEVKIQQLACFLDPRHKSLLSEGSTERSSIREEARKRVEQKQLVDNTGSSNNNKKTVLDMLLGDAEEDGGEEFDRYLAEPQIDRNLDPALWWREHTKCYPTLANIAKGILSVPATSASAERDFSCAGYIVSSRRNCLHPGTVNFLVFLHQNRELLLNNLGN